MKVKTHKKVQLYSGGLDSYIISRLWKPDVKLYFDYGTEQNKNEIKRLPPDVIVKQLPIGEYTEDDGIHTIPLRNLIFAAVAVNYGDIICIGGLKTDLHFDKKPEFAKQCTELFNSVLNRERSQRDVHITIPFADYSKTDLVYEFLSHGGTVEELDNNSWSCHEPVDGKPCGHCQACKARAKAIAEAKEMINR